MEHSIFIIGVLLLLSILYFINSNSFSCNEKFCGYNLSSFGNIYQQCMHPGDWGFKYSTGPCPTVLRERSV